MATVTQCLCNGVLAQIRESWGLREGWEAYVRPLGDGHVRIDLLGTPRNGDMMDLDSTESLQAEWGPDDPVTVDVAADRYGLEPWLRASDFDPRG